MTLSPVDFLLFIFELERILYNKLLRQADIKGNPLKSGFLQTGGGGGSRGPPDPDFLQVKKNPDFILVYENGHFGPVRVSQGQ